MNNHQITDNLLETIRLLQEQNAMLITKNNHLEHQINHTPGCVIIGSRSSDGIINQIMIDTHIKRLCLQYPGDHTIEESSECQLVTNINIGSLSQLCDLQKIKFDQIHPRSFTELPSSVQILKTADIQLTARDLIDIFNLPNLKYLTIHYHYFNKNAPGNIYDALKESSNIILQTIKSKDIIFNIVINGIYSNGQRTHENPGTAIMKIKGLFYDRSTYQQQHHIANMNIYYYEIMKLKSAITSCNRGLLQDGRTAFYTVDINQEELTVRCLGNNRNVDAIAISPQYDYNNVNTLDLITIDLLIFNRLTTLTLDYIDFYFRVKNPYWRPNAFESKLPPTVQHLTVRYWSYLFDNNVDSEQQNDASNLASLFIGISKLELLKTLNIDQLRLASASDWVASDLHTIIKQLISKGVTVTITSYSDGCSFGLMEAIIRA